MMHHHRESELFEGAKDKARAAHGNATVTGNRLDSPARVGMGCRLNGGDGVCTTLARTVEMACRYA